jgi:hypothetical protein
MVAWRVEKLEQMLADKMDVRKVGSMVERMAAMTVEKMVVQMVSSPAALKAKSWVAMKAAPMVERLVEPKDAQLAVHLVVSTVEKSIEQRESKSVDSLAGYLVKMRVGLLVA